MCCELVQKVIDFSIEVIGVIDEKCELFGILQANLDSPRNALKICKGLGLNLRKHLWYVNKDMVDLLQIGTKDQKDMWRLAEQIQREMQERGKNGLALPPKAQKITSNSEKLEKARSLIHQVSYTDVPMYIHWNLAAHAPI